MSEDDAGSRISTTHSARVHVGPEMRACVLVEVEGDKATLTLDLGHGDGARTPLAAGDLEHLEALFARMRAACGRN